MAKKSTSTEKKQPVNHSEKVVIFCGGRGLRFREETELRPKPLIAVGEKPILWHIMKVFSHYGFNNFVLPVGYKGEMIRQYFVNYQISNTGITVGLDGSRITYHGTPHDESSWNVTMVDTGLDTQTGARLSRVRPYIDSDYFFLTYGDGVADINISRLLAFHKKHGKIGTITGAHPVPRFGELLIGGNMVKKFSEKPQSTNTFINGGFMVFDKRIFKYVSDTEDLSFEQEPLRKLAEDRELMVYKHKGFWHPMDTYRDWQKLNDLWCEDRAPWKIWE